MATAHRRAMLRPRGRRRWGHSHHRGVGPAPEGYDQAREAQASAEMRAAAAAEARARLTGRDQDLSRFEKALEQAERAYPVREDNELFTMSAPLAVLRYAGLEVGRRLSQRGSPRAPDVMHLEVLGGRWLRQSRKEGAWLGLFLLPVRMFFWIGFLLPAWLILGPLRAALIRLGWRHLR